MRSDAVKVLFSFLLVISLTACSNSNFKKQFESDIGIDDIVSVVEENAYTEFGYSEVSQYYLSSYFSDLENLKNARIYTCNDSLNFNEFGIFEFISCVDAQKALESINSYLMSAKKNFENGVIYNVEEYPKFQNAKARAFENYVVYVILDSKSAENIFDSIEKL